MIIVLLTVMFLSVMIIGSIGVYLHLTQRYSHPDTLKRKKSHSMECKLMAERSDENIWTLVEGLAGLEEHKLVEEHLALCESCGEHYGTRVQALRATDPVRYNALYSEMINVKKAKLLRKARGLGLEVDLAPIKNLFELYRIALVINLSPEEQHLISVWDNASESDKSKMILNFTKSFNLF